MESRTNIQFIYDYLFKKKKTIIYDYDRWLSGFLLKGKTFERKEKGQEQRNTKLD